MNPVRSHEATEVLRPPVGWDDGDPDALPRGVELVCIGTRHPIVSLGVACPELENGGLGRADVSAAR